MPLTRINAGLDANQGPVPLQAPEPAFLCPHFRGRQEKWTSLNTTLLSVAKNRMREHLDAAERQKSTGEIVPVASKRTFGEVTETDRHPLQASEISQSPKRTVRLASSWDARTG